MPEYNYIFHESVIYLWQHDIVYALDIEWVGLRNTKEIMTLLVNDFYILWDNYRYL